MNVKSVEKKEKSTVELVIEIDPGEVEYTTKYIESGQELMMYNGKVYGVPLGTEVEVLYYNRDIVSDDIVSSWTSWEDMMAWAKTYNHFGQGVSTRDEQFGQKKFETGRGGGVRRFAHGVSAVYGCGGKKR